MIAAEKFFDVLAVGQVQAAAPGHQEFARRARHALVDGDRVSGACEIFSGKQAGRPGPDDRDTRVRGLRLCGVFHHEPVFDIETQGSCGGRAAPFCSNSMETRSGERTKAM